MLSTKQKKLFHLCAQVAFAVPLTGGVIAYYVDPDSALGGWGISIGLLLGGVYMCVLTLQSLAERQPVNRWVRAARWAGLLCGELGGALCIGLGMIIILGYLLGRLPAAVGTGVGVLFIVGTLLILVAGLVALGLLGTGYIAQGNEETRQWSRAFGQRHAAAPTGPTEEEQPPA